MQYNFIKKIKDFFKSIYKVIKEGLSKNKHKKRNEHREMKFDNNQRNGEQKVEINQKDLWPVWRKANYLKEQNRNDIDICAVEVVLEQQQYQKEKKKEERGRVRSGKMKQKDREDEQNTIKKYALIALKERKKHILFINQNKNIMHNQVQKSHNEILKELANLLKGQTNLSKDRKQINR